MRKYIPTDKILSSVILIKPTPYRKVLQSGHRQSGFQDLFLFLKPLRDVAVLIFIGIKFQITLPKFLIEFLLFFSITI